MLRAVFRSLPLLLALVALAPMQCGKSQDPSLQKEDTPGDALYTLAQDFRTKGNEVAYRDTLKFLVKQYPSSRRALAARSELESDAAAGR
jgi:hypothetical protein